MISFILTSSAMILAILLLRRISRGKLSPQLTYGLWLLVAVRLLMPVGLGESAFSISGWTFPQTV